jgi:predicted Rossmann-fold nucleotide-binding protein
VVALPGGYGTLDELFEVLTLVQTGEVRRLPIVLVGAGSWRRAIDFEFLVAAGYRLAGGACPRRAGAGRRSNPR